MEMALTAKNKIYFLDGSIPKPSSTDSSFSAWTRCNTMALSWIEPYSELDERKQDAT
jgi:hypothetical protein